MGIRKNTGYKHCLSSKKWKVPIFKNPDTKRLSLPLSTLAQALTILVCSSTSFASQSERGANLSSKVQVKVDELVEADSRNIEAIFKDIHRNPKLGFMEVRTAGIVEKHLLSLGFEVSSGIGKKGILAVLRNGEGPTVLYRADMDANAVKEITDLPYASTVRATLPDGSEVPVAHM